MPFPRNKKKMGVQNPLFASYVHVWLRCVHTYLEQFQTAQQLEMELTRTDLDMVCGLEHSHMRDLINTPGWNSYITWAPVMPFDIPKLSKWETEAIRGNYAE